MSTPNVGQTGETSTVVTMHKAGVSRLQQSIRNSKLSVAFVKSGASIASDHCSQSRNKTIMCEATEKHQAEFSRRCREVYAANPLRDFVRELIDQGVTEQQLQTMLAAQPALPMPFKVGLHNEYRNTCHLLLAKLSDFDRR